jgi:hypothetical protein
MTFLKRLEKVKGLNQCKSKPAATRAGLERVNASCAE